MAIKKMLDSHIASRPRKFYYKYSTQNLLKLYCNVISNIIDKPAISFEFHNII